MNYFVDMEEDSVVIYKNDKNGNQYNGSVVKTKI